MNKISVLTEDYISGETSITEMEYGYLKQTLQLCLCLLKFVIMAKLSSGKITKPQVISSTDKLRNSGKRQRKYLSLFGVLEFSRPTYHSEELGMLYPLDEALCMPMNLWSYNIQELTAQGASETSFRESILLLNQLLGLNLTDPASERNVERLGNHVDNFYDAQLVEQIPDNACFCASFDGKGVPKIKPRNSDASQRFDRLGKGQKRGIKQMATVSVMSWFKPRRRDKSSIIKGLMGWHDTKQENQNKNQSNDNRWHQDIHRRAFLADQDKAIDYGMAYIKARISHPAQRFVVPVDAGIGLENSILKYAKQHGLSEHFDGIILDIIHVSEYVWDCANAVLGEKSTLRTSWVKEMLEDLLDAKTQKVIKDLKLIVDKGSITQARKDKIQKAITYFTNHAHKMDYKTYLDKGYPISSALVESNCKHLVKDRMEQSGMRWSSAGAQSMMDVRAAKLNGDLPNLISFIAQQERKIMLPKAA